MSMAMRTANGKQDNLTARSGSAAGKYALQSPFTGEFHYPGNRYWVYKRSKIKAWLEQWGVEYEDADINDGCTEALALKGWASGKTTERNRILSKAKAAAEARLAAGNWPFIYWGHDGQQKPVRKTYKEAVRAGSVPTTFWVEEDERR